MFVSKVAHTQSTVHINRQKLKKNPQHIQLSQTLSVKSQTKHGEDRKFNTHEIPSLLRLHKEQASSGKREYGTRTLSLHLSQTTCTLKMGQKLQ